MVLFFLISGPFKASNNSTMNPGFVTASEENMIFTKTRTTMGKENPYNGNSHKTLTVQL